MYRTVLKAGKWVALPALLMVALFSRSSAGYDFLVDIVICLGALLVVQQSVRLKEYFWAAGFVAIALVFSPLLLVVKIFLMMGLLCIATLVTLLTTFRSQPVPAA